MQGITQEELAKFQESFKNDEFRKLFFEYMEEISDPKNLELYEKELAQLEAEKGFKVTYIKPEPAFAVKIGPPKAFVNICQAPEVDKPTPTKTVRAGMSGTTWSIPYSVSNPRDDVDHQNAPVKVYDCVFHPETIEKAFASQAFQKLVISTALEGLSKHFDVPANASYKILKMKSKGKPQMTTIRTKDDEIKSKTETTTEYLEKLVQKQAPSVKPAEKPTPIPKKGPVQPIWKLVHQNQFNDYQKYTSEQVRTEGARPDNLVMTVQLDAIQSAAEIELDITEKTFHLKVPEKYELNVDLPFEVDKTKGAAKFDKAKKSLQVTMPVIPLIFELPSIEPDAPEPEETTEDAETADASPPVVAPTIPTPAEATLPSPVESTVSNPVEAPASETAAPETAETADNAVVETQVQEPADETPKERPVETLEVKPKFKVHQDKQICSLVFEIPQIVQESVQIDFLPTRIAVRFKADTAYFLELHFESSVSEYKSSVTEENLVIVLFKDEKRVWKQITDTDGQQMQFMNMDNADQRLQEPESWIADMKAKQNQSNVVIQLQHESVAQKQSKPVFVNNLLFEIE
ncbi:pre-RNA processing PIH1/Nop17-domain-containing protein [Gorgonomyces haynaldii]|nr:pre-RNA processing PIH1/Nop17-domain-containing protein [Gorgonomyces haynaldii]